MRTAVLEADGEPVARDVDRLERDIHARAATAGCPPAERTADGRVW